jgi:hypothetical protein
MKVAVQLFVGQNTGEPKMKYVSIDYKGRAHIADAELLDDYKSGVREDGGVLLRIDGDDVSQYTGNQDDEWELLY